MEIESEVKIFITPKESDLNITIDLKNLDPDLEPEDLNQRTIDLLQQLQDLDEVKDAKLVRDLAPPPGSKPLDAAFLIGLLNTEISISNLKDLMGFLWERLSGKPFELEVEGKGKKLKIKVNNQQELSAAIEAAKDFLKSE
jgi:hypothetical protein